jgi:integrase/recombinase XerD
MSRRGILSSKPKAFGVCLPLEMWPEQDQLLWNRALQNSQLLEDGGFGREWRPNTAAKYARDYGRWLAWIAKTERNALALQSLERVTKARVRAYVEHMRTTLEPYSVSCLLRGLGSVAWAFAETNDYYWVTRFAGRLAYRAVPARNLRQMVKPTYDLVALGEKLMASASGHGSRVKGAIAFRNGLMIALLAYRPIRRTNLTSIEIGRHLTKAEASYTLHFEEHETKQHNALDIPIPESLTDAVATYLLNHRPVLLSCLPHAGTAGNSLWVASDGGALSQWGIYNVVTNETRHEFGHSLSPHIFRHSAATTVALDDPGQIAILTDVLGHSTLVTSSKHYNQARCIDASRRYQRRFAELKRGA